MVSLRLEPADGAPPWPFEPGQYVTLEVPLPGAPAPLVRCYSLSDVPDGRSYRITVREAAPADGRPSASTHLVRDAAVGDLLALRPPAGTFTLAPAGEGPLVLLAGGIGITPLLALARSLVATSSPRETWLLHGVRSREEQPFAAELRALAAARPRLRYLVCASRPGPDERTGRDHDHAGRVTVELLQRVLPPAELPYEFYLCGPPAFLADLERDLESAGVPRSLVHTEAFGAASARRLTRRRLRPVAEAVAHRVTFARSGKTATWSPAHETLLYLAESVGAPIPYACGAGRCGTCLTRVSSGEVTYPVPPTFAALRPGACLPCVAVPASDLILEA